MRPFAWTGILLAALATCANAQSAAQAALPGFAELETDALNDKEILALAQNVSHDTDPGAQRLAGSGGQKIISVATCVARDTVRQIAHRRQFSGLTAARSRDSPDIPDPNTQPTVRFP